MIYVAYMLFINFFTFFIMWLDKQKARRGKWRIPEIALLGSSLIGGAFGAFLAMHIVHHKTRHWQFAFGIPIMMVLHVCLAIHLLESGKLF